MPGEATGKRFRGARAERGLSQAQLGKELGISVDQVSRIERGQVDAGLTLAVSWARACGVKISRLTGEVADG